MDEFAARRFTIEPELEGVLLLGAMGWRVASFAPDALDQRVETVQAELATKVALAAQDDPLIQRGRSLYRAIGIDPTRVRPSSEALLRRLRKGDAFPRHSPLVDACNLASLATGLPHGAYDATCVEGDIVVRLGGEGEEYEGVRKDVVHLQGRFCLADERSAFGNPSADSKRTAITADTRDVVLVQFAPTLLTPADVHGTLDTAAAILALAGAGEECWRVVI